MHNFGGRRFSRAAIARLRTTALLAISAVATVALIEAGTLILLGTRLPHYDRISGGSAERHALVNEIAYGASVAATVPGASERVIAKLQELDTLQRSFDDLQPPEQQLYAQFVREASQAASNHRPDPRLSNEAATLSSIFSVKTQAYIDRGESLRDQLVIGVVIGSAVLLLAAIGLYVFAMVPTVEGVNLSLQNEALARNRLRIASSLSFARGDEVAPKIDETLAFAAESLGADLSFAGLIFGDTMTTVHGSGGDYERGATAPLVDSLARRVFGSREVLADETSIATTLFIEDEPVGVVLFRSYDQRDWAFREHDHDFVRVVASFVGNAMEREQRESKLSQMAYLDPLTHLPNRTYVVERLNDAIENARQHNDRVCVHFIDLDGFKRVNDELGHGAGDEVLRVIAARMKNAVRGSDILARIGGDEFLVLQLAMHDDEGAMLLAQRFVHAASEPMLILGISISLGASVGIARYPRDAGSAGELVERADQAMYAAKRSGKNRALLYDPDFPVASGG
jgi:diguanylate cyclase (GGDEF)-like protein